MYVMYKLLASLQKCEEYQHMAERMRLLEQSLQQVRRAMNADVDSDDSDDEFDDAPLSPTKPYNPRDFDRIEGGRSALNPLRTTQNALKYTMNYLKHSNKPRLRHFLPRFPAFNASGWRG